MNAEQELIERLSELIGQELTYDGDTCDLVVAERAVMLKYRPNERTWFAVTVAGTISPRDDPRRMEVLEAALISNLFGRYTRGLQFGLYGEDLMVFDRLPAAGLTAETLAERLVFLATHTTKMVSDWREYCAQGSAGESSEPRAENFWQFLRV